MATPNIYADQTELLQRNVPRHYAMILSIHPHNDRRTALASAAIGVMTVSARIIGTLYGSGSPTSNDNVVALCPKRFTQGLDPRVAVATIDTLPKHAHYS